jgi:hypothetical protein
VAWERHYDAKYGAGRAISRLPHGGFAIAGDVQRSSIEYQASLLQIDAAGEIVRATSLGPRGITGFNAIHAHPDGTFVAAGSAAGKGWVIAIDPTLRTLHDRALATDGVNMLAVLPSGDISALGSLEKSTTGYGRAQLSALAADGQIRWQLTLPTSERGDPSVLVAHHDGVLAMGTGAAAERAPAHVWLAYVDATAQVAWERTIGAAPANAHGYGAVALPTGYAIAGEIAPGNGRRTPHIWRVNDDGSPLWDQSYQTPGDGQAFEILNGIDALPDGSLIIVGSTSRGAGKSNVWIERIGPDGAVIWQRVFGSAASGAA